MPYQRVLLTVAFPVALWIVADIHGHAGSDGANRMVGDRRAENQLYNRCVSVFIPRRRLRLTEDPSQPTVVSTDKPQDVIWEPPGGPPFHADDAGEKRIVGEGARGDLHQQSPFQPFRLSHSGPVFARPGDVGARSIPIHAESVFGPNFERRTGAARFRKNGSVPIIGAPGRTPLVRSGHRHPHHPVRYPAPTTMCLRNAIRILDGRPAPGLSSEGLADADAVPICTSEARGWPQGTQFADDVLLSPHGLSRCGVPVAQGMGSRLDLYPSPKTFTSGIAGTPMSIALMPRTRGIAELRYHISDGCDGHVVVSVRQTHVNQCPERLSGFDCLDRWSIPVLSPTGWLQLPLWIMLSA